MFKMADTEEYRIVIEIFVPVDYKSNLIKLYNLLKGSGDVDQTFNMDHFKLG